MVWFVCLNLITVGSAMAFCALCAVSREDIKWEARSVRDIIVRSGQVRSSLGLRSATVNVQQSRSSDCSRELGLCVRLRSVSSRMRSASPRMRSMPSRKLTCEFE